MRVKKRIGNYELIELVGIGGSSRVFSVGPSSRVDKGLWLFPYPKVAVKIVEKFQPHFEECVLLLRNEAKFARLSNHSGGVNVLHLVENDDGAHLFMELMEGRSLFDLIASGQPIDEVKLLKTGLEIARTLAAAQTQHVIHCDIKPANILYTASGVAKLGDFGLARYSNTDSPQTLDFLATPDYAAPEVLSGKKGLDFHNDLYSLGGCLYHALIGNPPYKTEGLNRFELVLVKSNPIAPFSFAVQALPETKAIIQKMLHPNPQLRFPTYAALDIAICEALGKLGHPQVQPVSKEKKKETLLNPLLRLFHKG